MKKLKVLERKDTVRDFYGNFKYDKIYSSNKKNY